MTDVGHPVAMANRVIPGVQEVTSFIMMYSALLDRGYSRDEFEKKISSREPDGKWPLSVKYGKKYISVVGKIWN